MKKPKRKTKIKPIPVSEYKSIFDNPNAKIGDALRIRLPNDYTVQEPKIEALVASYFPIVIKIFDSEEIQLINKVEDLPINKLFVILKTSH